MNDCIIYGGGKTGPGYGAFYHDRKQFLAHRVSWELAYGPIPIGMLVCHKCDNPVCINPDHLFLGTHADNMADMAAKGRGRPWVAPKGEAHHWAKLTNAQAAEIIVLRKQGKPLKEIASKYGVSDSLVSAICTGVRRG